MNELISVIVPVYDVEDYLDRCVDSIINQTYKNLEIILVDDGSTDRSGKICEEYRERDARIKVIHKENGGLSSARNAGLDIAQGSFIGFVDSDDYIALDMYEALYQHMKPDIEIVSCGIVLFDCRHHKSIHYISKGVVELTTEEALRGFLDLNILSLSSCDKLFRKELIGNLRFQEGKSSEDIPFVYYAIKSSNKVVNIGKAKYLYQYRENSITRSEFTRKRMDEIYFIRDICKDVENHYPQLLKNAQRRYFLTLCNTINNIENCANKNKYMTEQNRLKQALQRSTLAILFNPYINKKEKKNIYKTARKN